MQTSYHFTIIPFTSLYNYTYVIQYLQSVRIWNIENGRCLRWISVSQTTSVMSVSYSQGHVACSYGETICVYRVEGPTKLIRKYLDIVNEHQKRIECLKFRISDQAKSEGVIVSAGKDGRLKYWDIQKEKSIQTFVGHKGKERNCDLQTVGSYRFQYAQEMAKTTNEVVKLECGTVCIANCMVISMHF
ncbi:hypothetical protein MAR_018539 [Mya arenaria]|uniref:Uncharacterized protein n=1 Tax=Mya arenaria TaxID=6604 RepID=A0ABY7EIF4_MYAAR|nr:hypothetical protein MAR_018539 [Mya arenaria]